MLVLTRKKNESIIINDNIKIMVVEIHVDKVRIGIEAPIEVPVHRQEVWEAVQRENTKLREVNDPKLGKMFLDCEVPPPTVISDQQTKSE